MMVYLVALVSIACSAFAQYFLKIGVGRLSLSSSDSLTRNFVNIITNGYLIGGLICYVASMLFWLYVLSKMEMSKAYPLVSIGYVFTLFIGYFMLNESISFPKVVGILLIVAGVIFITRA